MALVTAATPEPKRHWPLMTAFKRGLHFIEASLAGVLGKLPEPRKARKGRWTGNGG